MSLAPGEQRLLAEIDRELRDSDPWLNTMLTSWTSRYQGQLSFPLSRRAFLRLPRRRGESGHFLGLIALSAGLAVIVGAAIAGVLTIAALS
jgi:hypothetical protein